MGQWPASVETLASARTECDASGGERLAPAAWEATLLRCDRVAHSRNNAGHPGIVHAERVSAMMEQVKVLGEAVIFRKMADLRDGLRHPDVLPRT